MKANGIPVTYLLATDEGHGFQRPEDNLAFFGVAEQFLGKCLGGRAEPLGDVMTRSSIKVVAGGDAAGVLELREEALDQIALPAKALTEARLSRRRRDASPA